MAGFEVIVRPAVFPNIRPAPPRVLAPEDNPEQGKATIGGGGGGVIGESYSSSISISRNRPTEQKRRVDETRVYQKDDKGNVNKSNFIDVDVMNKVWMSGLDDTVDFYERIKEADNIEIKRENVIKKGGEETSE